MEPVVIIQAMNKHLPKDEWYAVLRKRWNDTFLQRFWAKITKGAEDDCWLWNGYTGTHGYGSMSRFNKATLVHRIAYEIEFGPIPNGLFVCHKCDVKLCCNPSHFFLGTSAENTKDATSKGLMPKGETAWMFGKRGALCPNSKLTDQDVKIIKEQSKRRVPQATIGRTFGVTQAAISLIVTGKTWNHIRR